MQKTYVLDTNVLIQAPHALRCFEDNRVVLPLAVLEELDGLKNSEGERGANARQAIRFLETLRRAGSLPDGVPLPGGGSLRLEVNCVDVALPEGFAEHRNDNRILKVCLGLQRREAPVILVTKDIEDAALRVEHLTQMKGINLYAQAERNDRLGIMPSKEQLQFVRYIYSGMFRKCTWSAWKTAHPGTKL